MIDLGKLEAALAEAESGRTVTVKPAWMRQIITELRAGRAAEARLGKVFGRPGGRAL